MGKKLQLIGKRFGRLLVIKEVEQLITNHGKVRRFECKCDCGSRKVIRIDALKGSTKSCGCLNRENNIKRQTKHGKHDHPLYKRWDAMRQRFINPNNSDYKNYGGRGFTMYDDWLSDFKSFYDWCMNNNYRPQYQLVRIDKNKGFHPDNLRFKKKDIEHGLTDHELYSKWDGIKQRCNNPKHRDYKNYGGRDIKLCRSWGSNFLSFYNWCMNNGWKEGLQIDRIDGNAGYNPDNCRFVEPRDNTLNRHRKYNTNKSGYTGISWSERDQKWVSRINIKGKTISLGNHKTKRAALDARNDYIILNKLNRDYKVQRWNG